MALPKQVTHYGTRSCLPYHNISPHSPSKDFPYTPHGDTLSSSVGFGITVTST